MAKPANSEQFVNFYEIAGGDGVPDTGNTGPGDPILAAQPSDASADDAALEAHIAQVTGLPIARTEVKTDDNTATGADDNAADGAASAGADSGAGGGQADGGNTGGDQGQGTGIADAGSGDAGSDGGQGDAGAGAGDKGTQQEAAEAAAKKPVEKAPEIKAEDYALEVEDADGKKFTITSIDDLPDDFTPKNNKQALQILDDLRSLQTQRQAAEDATKLQEAETQKAQAEAVVQKSWMTEIEALQADGRIDKPKIAEGQPGFLEDPGVKRVDAVFKFMLKENGERIKKGIQPIRSFTDALTHLELQEMRAQKTADAKASGDRAKQKASILSGAGTGSNSSGSVDKPYVAGQAQDIFDALRS